MPSPIRARSSNGGASTGGPTPSDPGSHPSPPPSPRSFRPPARPEARPDGDPVTARRSHRCDRCRREIALPGIEGERLGDPEQVADHLVPLIGGADREHCIVVLLDTKHRVLRTSTVSIGSIDHTFMTPHGIFRDALLGNAAAVILAHNHPSGDPEPSRDDERVTRRLVEAGRLMGVEVLDHLVIGGGTWVSLARRGLV
jgi:DNA repair protein RadC